MQHTDIPAPILFHPLKHHLGYIREFIKEQATAEEAALVAQLKTIGSSQLDLYLGELLTQQIAYETILYLQKHQILEPEAFQTYLSSNKADYRVITLSDESSWVLRWGIVEGRHVHLHPARYSQHTIRVKANTLKTAIAAKMAALRNQQPPNLQMINRVRQQWLNLPPVPLYLPQSLLHNLLLLLKAC
ncbi:MULTISPECIES: hypothetical protein [Pontibacter]|uniref:Uncharacterized protein n=1 Tax=Pontibacter lucknowensis TaxID=1077936 RepID=A0A1N7B855_9BACT|nr:MULTISPECIES: hypothetical protein [Pontibacter]EJF10325.1 hypothetical protein O71_09844 [Pontibacter sp. BAB1700]SIR47443.1 hypothetical protein SAMN05421545_3794 [Pontibacter lucknowensis]